MKKYAVTDIETTGGLYNRDKIIEIAIIVTDGYTILEQFESLINPERSIPYSITRITRINNDMVADAPKFYEVAKDIVEIMEGCIFIAHNVKFDYGFIKQEFKNLGYPFNKKRLCTVKLTRRHVPGLKSYGLDNLIKYYGLKVTQRHRAYGDTYATYEIFKDLFQNEMNEFDLKQAINEGLDATVLPNGLSIDELQETPETPGVYYLSNVHKRIIYVGKAKNIKTRLFQHFRKLSRKAVNIANQVYHVHHHETGHELIALLLELHEIKTLRPELNKALRRNNYTYALYYNPKAIPEKPLLLLLRNNKKNDLKYEKIKLFGSKQSGDGYLQNLIIEHQLCAKYGRLRSKELVCNCGGVCSLFFEHQQEYIESLLDSQRNEFDYDFVILTDGREPNENSFALISNQRFRGIGFISKEETLNQPEEWVDHLTHEFFYPEANGIIKTYMSKKPLKMISLNNLSVKSII